MKNKNGKIYRRVIKTVISEVGPSIKRIRIPEIAGRARNYEDAMRQRAHLRLAAEKEKRGSPKRIADGACKESKVSKRTITKVLAMSLRRRLHTKKKKYNPKNNTNNN